MTTQTTSDPIFSPLERKTRRESVKFAVQRQMFCAVTQKVLDCRSALLVTNRDNGKMCVLSREGWKDTLSRLAPGWSKTLEVWDGKTGEEIGE